MIEDLKKFIIEEYVLKNKEIDEAFYKGIIYIFWKFQKLGEYVRNIKFEDFDNGATASYDKYENEIIISESKANEDNALLLNSCSDKFNDEEVKAFKYFNVARVVLHELSHAVQNKNRDENSTNDIKSLKDRSLARIDPYQIENMLYLKQNYGLEVTKSKLRAWEDYKKSKYGCDFMHERDAEIQSYSIIMTILKEYENKYPHIATYMKANFYESIAMGYDLVKGKVVSPAHQVMEFLSKNDLVIQKNIEWYDSDVNKSTNKSCSSVPNMSDRFKIGMPVTPEELYRVFKVCAKFEEQGYVVIDYDFGIEDNNDPDNNDPDNNDPDL